MALSNPVGGSTASMIVFRKRPAMKAMPSHRAPVRMLGMAAKMRLSMFIAGTESASIPSTPSAAIATGMMMNAKARMPNALAIVARVAPGVVPGGTAAGSVRTVPAVIADPDARHQPVDIGGVKHRFDQPARDPRDDQPDEEDQPGAEQARQEGKDFGGELIDRGEDLAEPEHAQRGDDADQPHDQLGDGAELLPERFRPRAGAMLAQRLAPVDCLLEPPRHRARDQPGGDDDEQREQDLGAPQERLVVEIDPGGCRLVHQSLPVQLANPRAVKVARRGGLLELSFTPLVPPRQPLLSLASNPRSTGW